VAPANPAVVRADLLAWYDRHRRDLPWRGAPGATLDPYRVWVSEVMLQQTRVETVRPYFERWMDRFPDLATLADADIDDVLKAWEGLGYYTRARNLHGAAREVVARYGGEIPSTPAGFRALPGVGRYTAGAVMSIAFGREEPIVDGNVKRVLARLANSPDPSQAELWTAAAVLVRGERPGDLNQAVMDLGATICTPRTAACDRCPLHRHCGSARAGTVSEIPKRRKAAPVPVEREGVCVVLRGREVLLARRPEGGRLGGLWHFPGRVQLPGEDSVAAAIHAAEELVSGRVRVGARLGSVEHLFSHVRVVYEVFLAVVSRAEPRPGSEGLTVWATSERLADLALPRAQRRIAALVPEAEGVAGGAVATRLNTRR
jgi:A/G-specific adenine glycosylase